MESKTQEECNKILRDLKIEFVHIPANVRKRMHRKGMPDLLFYKDPNAFAIELKDPGKALSKDQSDYMERLHHNGWICRVCFSTEGFLDILKEYGVIR